MKAISFNAISIAAILAGRKTMTRRPLGKCERWHVGDEAWVRTGWTDEQGKQHPAMFMKRENSPFSIRITAHWVECVQEISAEDVECEGIDVVRCLPKFASPTIGTNYIILWVARRLFELRWDAIYAKVPGKRWRDNPAIEALTFEVIKEEEK